MKTGDEKEENQSPSDIEVLKNLVLQLQQENKDINKKFQEVILANASGSPASMVKVLAEYTAALDKEKNIDFRAGIRAEDIPKDDYDENGVTFCAPFTGYAIADDRRQGHHVLLPYNKEYIFFEFQGKSERQVGKHIQLMNFSTYRSQSKKEIQWLREHTFFNTMFYESTRGVANFDVQRAMKLSRIMTTVTNFEMPQVMARAKEYGIAVDQDLYVMKTMLAMKMADRELESELTSRERRLAELEKEKMLLQKG